MCRVSDQSYTAFNRSQRDTKPNKLEKYLRWDHADLGTYYSMTGQLLRPLLDRVTSLEKVFSGANFDLLETKELILNVNNIYDGIVKVLDDCAKQTVPMHRKQFYKFLWNQELECLIQESIDAQTMWKHAGKPRAGQIFVRYRTTKMTYKTHKRMSETGNISLYE